MRFQIAFFRRKCRIGHIAGLFSQRSDNIAVTFLLQGSCMRLEFNRKVPLPAGKCCCRGTKIDALVDGKVFGRINVVLL